MHRACIWLLLWALVAGCNSGSSGGASGAEPPNVLLITIDTLRADHLPMYGYAGGRTPVLDALARESTVFDHVASHAPITLPSHTSILSGMYPPQHGARSNGSFRAPPELRTMAELLHERGYRTGGFISAFVLDSRFGLDQGFDVYDDDLVDGRKKQFKFAVKDRRAENTLTRAGKWITSDASDSKPFFSWVHLYDPHFPYDPPEPFHTELKNQYDGEIAYVDSQLGRFFAGLKKSGRLDNTLVVITSDHGESFGEHGESTHSLFVYEATQRVPLLVRLPYGRDGGRRVATLARHVDILPTVLAVVDKTNDAASLLAPTRVSPQAYAEAYLPLEQFGWSPLYAFRDARYKYIDAPRPELYDLDHDPHELRNLAETTDLSPYRARLAELQKGMKPVAEAATVATDEAAIAALSALGYVNRDEKRDNDRGRDPKDMIGLHETRELAHVHMDENDFVGALPVLQQAIAEDPSNHAIYDDLGTVYAELKRWRDAEQAYLRAKKLAPSNSEAYRGLAKVYFRGLGDFAAAEPEITTALELNPNDPGLWTLKGDFLHDSGRMAEAVEAYAKAVAMDDQNDALYAGYASALSNLGRLPEAKRMAKEAVRINDTNVIAFHNLGVILVRLGETAEAESSFRRAIALEPRRNMQTYESLAKLLDGQGREIEAANVLEEALRLDSEAAGVLYELGSLHLRHGRAAQALPPLEHAVKLRPRGAPELTNLGYAYEQLERSDDAIEQYTVLSTLFPKNTGGYADACIRLARLQAKQGKRDKAVANVRGALATGIPLVEETVRRDPVLQALR